MVTKYYCPKSIIGIQEALNAFQAVLGFPIVMVSMTKGRVPKNVVKSMVFCRLKQMYYNSSIVVFPKKNQRPLLQPCFWQPVKIYHWTVPSCHRRAHSPHLTLDASPTWTWQVFFTIISFLAYTYFICFLGTSSIIFSLWVSVKKKLENRPNDVPGPG